MILLRENYSDEAAYVKGNCPYFEETKQNEFNGIYGRICEDILDHPQHSDIPGTNKWIISVLEYNTFRNIHKRGIAVRIVFENFANNPSEEDIDRSNILGWCVELMCSSFRVTSNLIDGHQMYNGKTSWHENDSLGPLASNDSILLLSVGHYILQKYFGNEDYYIDMVNVFTDISKFKSLGKCIDLQTNLEDEMNSGNNSNYELIVKLEKSYLNLYFPVALGMIMAGVKNPKWFKQAKSVVLQIGSLLQVITDYRVGFNKSTAGIHEKRLTWMMYEALRIVNEKDKLILHQSYGKNSIENVQAVLKIYERLDIKTHCESYICNKTNEIRSTIKRMSEDMPHVVFNDILDYVLSIF